MQKCGTDIIEISRIKDGIERLGQAFKNRIYTEKEIEYCESKNVQKYQSYAGRFAAKEAIFKALSDIIEDKYKIKWTDLEIVNNKSGKPVVHINTNIIPKEKIKSINISISHCKDYSIAMCVADLEFNTK